MLVVGIVPLSEDQNIELMETIVSDQRDLLMDVFNTSDVTTIPQVWTLCTSRSPSFCQCPKNPSLHADGLFRQGGAGILRRGYARAGRRDPYVDGRQVRVYALLSWFTGRLGAMNADCVLRVCSWGNIRRYPLVSERNRTGGAGVYYHVCPSSFTSRCGETHCAGRTGRLRRRPARLQVDHGQSHPALSLNS